MDEDKLHPIYYVLDIKSINEPTVKVEYKLKLKYQGLPSGKRAYIYTIDS